MLGFLQGTKGPRKKQKKKLAKIGIQQPKFS
jgi:hypothetical protein